MENFENVLRPLTIKQTTFSNRIFVSAHSYGYADSDGLPTQQLIDYLAERAKGGVGLIIMGATGVSRGGWLGNNYTLSEDDRIIPKYQKIAESVHAFDTKIFDQLFHIGGQLAYDDGNRVFAPSAVPHPRTVSLPIELSQTQIRQILEDYTNAARRASLGGLDGIEITGAQGFLINEFLSPKFNRRHDIYGGSFENRMRFLVELLERIRSSVPDSFLVGYRMTADSLDDDDSSLEDASRIVRALEKYKLVDYVSVLAGLNGNYFGYWIGHGDMSIPSATFADLASYIRDQSDLPIFLASKIKDPTQAEYLIREGVADMVAMTRAHIADPEIINKIKANSVDDIRPCISCNQGCVGGSWNGTGVKCVLNAATGREGLLGIGTITKSLVTKKVVVVGGGPAGMEVARVAALRGHSVTLYERNSVLGGQLLLAKAPPFRNEFEDAISYLANQLKKLGVDIQLGVDVSAGFLNSLYADVIILATGAVNRLPSISIDDYSMVTTGWDVLDGTAKLGQTILIVDGDWKQHALSIAEFLANLGKSVEIITSRFYIGEGLNITNIVSFTSRLLEKGVKLTPLLSVSSINHGKVRLQHSITGEIIVRDNVDNVVFVAGLLPNNELYNLVKDKLTNLMIVGDCDYPRGLQNAVYDANVLARTI
jgi:2,4-dienoyl-CoA reductase-like NADH-dependent reductase (Old Yellow Enzyme family)/thioredoxin reductase